MQDRIDVRRTRESRRPLEIRRQAFKDHEAACPELILRYKTKTGLYRFTLEGQNFGLDLPQSLAFERVVQARGSVQEAFKWVLLTDPWDPKPWTHQQGYFGRLIRAVWRKYLLSDEADHLGQPRFRVVKEADGSRTLRMHRARRSPTMRKKFLYTSEVDVKTNLPASFEPREGFTIEEARRI